MSGAMTESQRRLREALAARWLWEGLNDARRYRARVNEQRNHALRVAYSKPKPKRDWSRPLAYVSAAALASVALVAVMATPDPLDKPAAAPPNASDACQRAATPSDPIAYEIDRRRCAAERQAARE